MHENACTHTDTQANIKMLKYQHVFIVPAPDLDNEQLKCHLPPTQNVTIFHAHFKLYQTSLQSWTQKKLWGEDNWWEKKPPCAQTETCPSKNLNGEVTLLCRLMAIIRDSSLFVISVSTNESWLWLKVTSSQLRRGLFVRYAVPGCCFSEVFWGDLQLID